MTTRTDLIAASVFILIGGAVAGLMAAPPDEPVGRRSLTDSVISKSANGAVSAEQLVRTLFPIPKADQWTPSVDSELSRGAGRTLYAKLAPAVVVIRSGGGHGTGFLIDKDGWIVTNHHVVEDGALDLSTGGLTVQVHFGSLKDQLMVLSGDSFPANVYLLDQRRDLALLKLTKVPDWIEEITPISVAAKGAVPADSCVVVGHPAAGLLWAVRTGEVSGVGTWPKDHISEVMEMLASTSHVNDSHRKALAQTPSRRIVLTNCGINPGDSGGPLVNTDGELIGVTVGIPRGGANEGISLDKFAYHVHRDELVKFLENRPKSPQVNVPSPWAAARVSDLRDVDEDGRWDTWAFAAESGGRMTSMMLDLDQ
ncbi:MAG: serine protease, partial [Planctomycetota bacterium]|nr:serine protease [Planctomycetota bacterium]